MRKNKGTVLSKEEADAIGSFVDGLVTSEELDDWLYLLREERGEKVAKTLERALSKIGVPSV